MKCLKITSFLLLVGITSAIFADRDVTPTIVVRSQGSNAVFKVAGLAEKVHRYDEGRYINIDGTLAYMRSFRDHRLAECLFGSDLVNCNSILLQGSNVQNRDAQAWLADYFYLPPDYNASFSVEPTIQNVLANLDLYLGLDEWLEGLYFRIHGPITWSKWDLKFNEPCDVLATGSFRAGYFDRQGMSSGQLLGTFGQYAMGQSPQNTSGTTAQPDLGVSFEGLKFAKIETCSRSRTGFADLRFELGYNFLRSDDYHLGLNVQVVAPSGNRREAEFAFDPVIGNGNHWEAGAGLSAHYIFWRAEGEDKFGGFYLDANITHINNGTEQRTFDLCGRPNSRYMLAEKMGRPVNFLTAASTSATTAPAGAVAPIAQFKGVFTPVANLTTLDVHVRASIQADVVAMFNFTTSSWGFDVGYNFWGRSCEKITIRNRPTSECCPNLCTDPVDSWALKGDAQVFGFLVQTGSTELSTDEPVALSATECGSTIHKGTNVDADSTACVGVDALQNCGVDNPEFAYGDGIRLTHDINFSDEANHINTSLEPKFINCCDINLARTRGISHKIFLNANHTWDKDGWTPYLGIGGSVEFGKHSSDTSCETAFPDCSAPCDPTACCDTKCSNCLDCAVSQWSLWLKGGLNFN